MLRDEAIESSGDGSPDVIPENKPDEIIPDEPEKSPEEPETVPETPEEIIPEEPEKLPEEPEVIPEAPEEIVVVTKPAVVTRPVLTKKPHRPSVNVSLPDSYIPAQV